MDWPATEELPGMPLTPLPPVALDEEVAVLADGLGGM
jgi:hypothetical protein